MAPFALLSGRRLAQSSELASPLVGNFISARSLGSDYQVEREWGAMSSPSPAFSALGTDSPVNPIPKLPTTTTGLIGFICFLVAGISIFGIWKIVQWRKKRKGSRKVGGLFVTDPISEKLPRPLILQPHIPLSPSVRWVPARISPWFDHRLPRKPTPSLSKDSILSRSSDGSYYISREKNALADTTPNKPSMYPTSADSTIFNPHQQSPPPPIFLAAVEKLILSQETKAEETRPSSLQLPPGLEVANSPAPQTAKTSKSEKSAAPSPGGQSVTSSENGSELCSSECSSVLDSLAQPGYPKLVIVKRTFPVCLPDELTVKEGERLRVLLDFKDGWALCQRTSRRNPQKGAVPRCCLLELSVDTANAQAGKSSRKEENYEDG